MECLSLRIIIITVIIGLQLVASYSVCVRTCVHECLYIDEKLQCKATLYIYSLATFNYCTHALLGAYHI